MTRQTFQALIASLLPIIDPDSKEVIDCVEYLEGEYSKYHVLAIEDELGGFIHASSPPYGVEIKP